MDVKAILISLLKITAFAYVVLLITVFFFQNKLIYHPFKKIEAYPTQCGLKYEDITLTTSDGFKINAWYIPREDALATVIFFHGNAGNNSHRLDTIALLYSLGLSVMIPDYRGYGKSEGSPSEQGTYKDANACHEWLVEKGVKKENLIVFGRSLGGALAIYLAEKTNPALLIVESSFVSIPAMGKKLYPFLPIGLIARSKYDSLSRIKNISCPKLFIHSPDDEIIPFSQGKLLFDQAKEPKQFMELKGDHNTGFLMSGRAYSDSLRKFITDNLKQE